MKLIIFQNRLNCSTGYLKIKLIDLIFFSPMVQNGTQLYLQWKIVPNFNRFLYFFQTKYKEKVKIVLGYLYIYTVNKLDDESLDPYYI